MESFIYSRGAAANTVPTALERSGDFSQTRRCGGSSPDHLRSKHERGISRQRHSDQPLQPVWTSVLNWLPLPNITGQPNYNYQSQVASSQPSFDQVYRVTDWNINDNWRFYGRHLNSKYAEQSIRSRRLREQPRHQPVVCSHSRMVLSHQPRYALGPTMTNEFQFGYTVNGIPGMHPRPEAPTIALFQTSIFLFFILAQTRLTNPQFQLWGHSHGEWNSNDKLAKVFTQIAIRFGTTRITSPR